MSMPRRRERKRETVWILGTRFNKAKGDWRVAEEPLATWRTNNRNHAGPYRTSGYLSG